MIRNILSNFARLSAFYLFLLATVSASAVEAADLWRWNAADIRIDTASPVNRSHQLRLDIPQELQKNVRGVAAFTKTGQPLQANLVKAGEVYRAAEIEIAASRNNRELPVEIYLSTKRQSPNRISPEARKPTAFFFAREQLRSRPLSFKELYALDHALQTPPFRQCTRDFSLPEKLAQRINHLRRRRRVAFLIRLSAMLKIEQQTTAVFGSDTRTSAWFLQVDGKPTASWVKTPKESTNEGDIIMSDAVKLLPGLHRLDFYTFADQNGKVAKLLWKERGKAKATPITGEQLTSPLTPTAYRFHIRNTAVSPAIKIRDAQIFQLPDTGRTISAWRFNIQNSTASSNPTNQTLKAGGQPLNGNGYMVFPDKEFPALSFTVEGNHEPRTVTIPEVLTWQTRRSIAPILMLEQLPIIIPADGTLTFTSHLTALPKTFKKSRNMSLQIRSRQFYDQQQQTIMSTMPIPETDKAETHSLNFSQAPKKIELTASLGNIPIAATRTLTCIKPDDSFRGVRPRGSHLYKANNPAVLVLNTSDTTRHKQKRQNNNSQKLESLFIVDEFWSIGKAPDGGQGIREIMAAKSGLSVSHKHIDTVKSASPRELKKFALVNKALNSDADAIVWAVGVTDLRAGIKYSEVINRLQFLTEATLARGKIPVLVTVPPVAGIPAEQLHRFAVALKQYGLGIKIPVVDTYSKAAANLKTFSAFLKTKDPQVNLSYPNVEGRRWFCRLLQNSLEATQNARSD